MDDAETLLAAVETVGLDRSRASEILDSTEFSQEVQSAQTRYKMLGVQGVPAFILNDRYMVEGAQPIENLIAAIEQAYSRSQGADAPTGAE
jgi:predicted DsbA family dithiol-disulfide isomerase